MPIFVLRVRWMVRYLVLLLLGFGIPSFAGYLIALEDRNVSTGAPGPVYQGSTDKRRIALTFNVFWGEEHLPQILQTLRRNNAKATFFLGGCWVDRFPELAQEIGRDFEVGSHSYYHRHPDRLSVAENLADLKRAEAAIRRVTKKRPRLFAPPYGECGPSILQAADAAGYRVVLWSIDTVDWKRPAAAKISGRVISRAHNGAIVLLHPTAPTAEALPAIIRELSGRGFEFVSVSDLLGAN
ncbi:MAG TPA: polysaccharide deacetylase [Desulfotomaculum sp.]|nr:polysaccharide deacetylase [Desulfotomaculum sp.]